MLKAGHFFKNFMKSFLKLLIVAWCGMPSPIPFKLRCISDLFHSLVNRAHGPVSSPPHLPHPRKLSLLLSFLLFGSLPHPPLPERAAEQPLLGRHFLALISE